MTVHFLSGWYMFDEFSSCRESEGPDAAPGEIRYFYQNDKNVYLYFMLCQLSGNSFDSLCIPDFNIPWGSDVLKASMAFCIDKSTMVISTRLPEAIQICVSSHKKRFTYLLLLIYESNRKHTHANILLIDKKKQTIERFEPFGHRIFNDSIVDKGIRKLFKKILGKEFIYMPPSLLSPKKGIQEKADSYDGMCITISILYVYLRVKYPDKRPMSIVKYLLAKTSNDLRSLILKFAKHIETTLKKRPKVSKASPMLNKERLMYLRVKK